AAISSSSLSAASLSLARYSLEIGDGREVEIGTLTLLFCFSAISLLTVSARSCNLL
uniref:Uncharacterized protein n=1 Tax=Amphimedon queenslandica TaxID=400682 RepID=A0A1X7VRY3_AMPQE